MRNVVYASKAIDLPRSWKKLDEIEVILTEDFVYAITGFLGVIISGNESSETIESIKESGYPVILWDIYGKENDNKGLTTYFSFKIKPKKEFFLQVLKNYIAFLKEKVAKQHFEIKLRAQEILTQELLQIGVALSAERNNSKLLHYIVSKACEITKADAGSLYLLDNNKETGESSMIFKISHNDSNKTDFSEFRMPLVKKSISGYVAITGTPLKLDDAYSIPPDVEYGFNKSYDIKTNYRTKSMLTVPMKNYKDKVIGVIQLINKKRKRHIILSDQKSVEESVITFDKLDEEIILSLSSLAAVSLDNNFLYNEIEKLFDSLVIASVKAIEQRDPTTGGHSSRVALYTIALADAVSQDNDFFKQINYSEDQLKGLKYACLLHDFGKVGVRENVLVKSKKLYPGMLEHIHLRLDNLISNIKVKTLEMKLMLNRTDPSYKDKLKELDLKEANEIEKLEKYREVVIKANEPAVLDSEPEKILSEIKNETGTSILSEKEYEFLSIKKGNLTKNERDEIMSHATHTYDFLKNIPWPESMEWIPEVAKSHHETLDGCGYPEGKRKDELPLESRLMAIADIFDALTASDRPYKKSMPVEQALKIIDTEATKGKLDRELVDIFIKKEVYKAAELQDSKI
ncbi:MAG: GAF domain-containing protein [Spirochaetaceae bacterium]|nr:GAF domain-containing protein [Spirochaetaceae bacterium]